MNDLAGHIIGHYERHAREWDADRRNNGWNDKPWLDSFIGALPKGATVLDLGCGSGSPVALHMIERELRVTGVDASPTLVSLPRPDCLIKNGSLRTYDYWLLAGDLTVCLPGTAFSISSRMTSAACSMCSLRMRPHRQS